MDDSLNKRDAAWAGLARLYGEAGVKEICLLLQDRAGVCVTALLTVVWSAAAGHGPLRPEAAAAVVAISERLEADVLRPLRRARNGLRGDARRDAQAAALRQSLLQRELEVERLVQERVLARIRPCGRRDHPGDAGDDARVALERYLTSLGVAATAGLRAPLRRIVTVAVAAR
ncbi:TIGR02444 family protein [Aquisalimonas sp.]|uniref:TIGR02444 family protein n=1 Tax=Aquisalimonas sp. TaxID=1872621 RepID=UPI0025BA56E3|nr:TIGR02444 family protein [Aquisalimonas sp.]